jgi:hypothetical protein
LAIPLHSAGRMRTFLCLSLLLLAPAARAQTVDLRPVAVDGRPILVEARPLLLVDGGSAYRSAMKLQVTGAIFMGAGIVHLVGTTIATGFAIDEANFARQCRTTGPPDCGGWGTGLAGASATFALGALFTIIGIPMYIEGTNRLHKLKVRTRVDAGGLRMTW